MALLATVSTDACVMAVPITLGTLLAFPWAYRAVVRLSRDSTGVDPDDLFNGTSSVLVVTAMIGCVLAWTSPPTHGFWLSAVAWPQQVLAAQSAAAIILVLASLTAISVGPTS